MLCPVSNPCPRASLRLEICSGLLSDCLSYEVWTEPPRRRKHSVVPAAVSRHAAFELLRECGPQKRQRLHAAHLTSSIALHRRGGSDAASISDWYSGGY
eukprot:1479292-Rhodomonas_salina.1